MSHLWTQGHCINNYSSRVQFIYAFIIIITVNRIYISYVYFVCMRGREKRKEGGKEGEGERETEI
jgi:hypothetical protein